MLWIPSLFQERRRAGGIFRKRKVPWKRERIAYAGKYSAPDYEKILNSSCGLAVESTMIYHTPEVKEQLGRLGIPVLVERSSYENQSAWAGWSGSSLYGLLTGQLRHEAEAVFRAEA